MHAALGTLATSRLGPGCDILAYIWPQSWWKPETLALPIRPGCAFDPKGDSRHHASDQSLKLFPDRRTTTSCLTRRSPPPVRAPPRSLPARTLSGFTISNGLRQSLNHRLARIQKRRSASLTRGRGCRRCSTTNCWQRQRFSAISSAFGLKIAPMAKTSNRNTCAAAAIIPARAPRRRLVNTKPSGSTPDQYLRLTSQGGDEK